MYNTEYILKLEKRGTLKFFHKRSDKSHRVRTGVRAVPDPVGKCWGNKERCQVTPLMRVTSPQRRKGGNRKPLGGKRGFPGSASFQVTARASWGRKGGRGSL